MNLTELVARFTHIIVHMTGMEVTVVLLANIAAAWYLATALDKRDDRKREARLARGVAAFYLALFVVLRLGAFFLA
jgi:hypothetical protein